MFSVETKQNPATIYTTDITLIDEDFSTINGILYKNNNIKNITKVKK
jgi:hypothetical protein